MDSSAKRHSTELAKMRQDRDAALGKLQEAEDKYKDSVETIKSLKVAVDDAMSCKSSHR
jgi:hypothetical protein